MDAPVVLHFKVPKESEKGPQACESVLAGLNELFKHQKTPVSLEIVVKGGFLYFFAVCERAFVDFLRGQFFAQYPNLEIQEISDYMSSVSPAAAVAAVKLERPDVYPIKITKISKLIFFPISPVWRHR